MTQQIESQQEESQPGESPLLSVVIPAFNEEEVLPLLLNQEHRRQYNRLYLL